MSGSVKITKNADLEKYKCSGDGIGFDYRSEFSLTDSSVDKNVISFGVDMSSSVHIDNKNKYILMLCKGTTQGLDNTTLTAEAEYFINFSRPFQVFIMMEATIFYSLMPQKYINFKQKTLK